MAIVPRVLDPGRRSLRSSRRPAEEEVTPPAAPRIPSRVLVSLGTARGGPRGPWQLDQALSIRREAKCTERLSGQRRNCKSPVRYRTQCPGISTASDPSQHCERAPTRALERFSDEPATYTQSKGRSTSRTVAVAVGNCEWPGESRVSERLASRRRRSSTRYGRSARA